MPVHTIEDIKTKVTEAALAYNEEAGSEAGIKRILLFGSYADGCAGPASDVDLLVSFQSSVVSLIALGKVLSMMEEALGTSVDIVQEPVPVDSFLVIKRKVPLYEGF